MRSQQARVMLANAVSLIYIDASEDMTMRTVEDLADEINLLPLDERLRLMTKISIHERDESLAEEARLVALDAFLALAGSAETDATNVASDKYQHLADIYHDAHELP